ncbi:MAG: acyl-CoA synthetase, partial [Burkholderiales bacterium]|nr:acyl-CoA synthetase [Burkholderiales bacterium]
MNAQPAVQHAHWLDRFIGAELPALASAAELREFERTPFPDRLAAGNIYEALQQAAARTLDAAALKFVRNGDPDKPVPEVSYREFLAKVTQAANLFTSLGVGANGVVSLLMPLLPQTFFALYGAQAVGIANPVNPLLSAEQIGEILRAAGTKVLVVLGPVPGSDIWDKVQRIRASLPDLTAVVAVHGMGAAGALEFDTAIAPFPADRLESAHRAGAHDTAGYFHTGGTTGTPKLVRHSHLNQLYQAWALRLMLGVETSKDVLFGLPLFHVGGALTQGLATLCAGGALVVVSASGWRDPKSIQNVWRLVQRFRPGVFGGVPTVLAAALNVPHEGVDLGCIEAVSGGGSAIPLAVGRAYQDGFGKPVIEVYGMTETSSVHTLAYRHRPIRLGSVGHAVPYSRVRIVKLDAEGRWLGDCAADEIGVVAMAGPGVFTGYLSEAHNRGAFVEPGWVNSGDLGRLDAEGYLWITGRAKDLIIRGGHNIDPQAIEEVFYRHPAVALVAVVGQPDAYAGELPAAFVQLKPGATVAAGELVEFVRERSPERAAVPVSLHFVDPMPLTAVGKVFKPALRLQAAERAVATMLADLGRDGARIAVAARMDERRGQLVRVTVGGAPAA